MLLLGSMAGVWLRRRYPDISDEHKDDLSIILAATLTLLALIIGFSFSMATARYDQRKNFEEAEANAIGTELLRADFLPSDDLKRGCASCSVITSISAYRCILPRTKRNARKINLRTGQLQEELWAAVRGPVETQQTPITALARLPA